jgi:hypothetical protein
LKPRETCQAAVEHLGAERVLVPDMLRIRIHQRNEPAK